MIAILENITKSFGGHLVLDNVTAKIEDQQRIGLIGANGAGKSTLLNILHKDLEPDSGSVVLGSGKSFGFLRQNNGLDNSNSIASEMRSVFAHLDSMEAEIKLLASQMAAQNPATEEYKKSAKRYASLQYQYELAEGYQIGGKIASMLNGMGFANTPWDKSIGVLSGGEKTRLAICKLLLESPELLILDEPTNHLDFPTLLWLEEYLSGYKGALLIVSHDRYFLDRLCTTMWEVENHKLHIYNSNYTQYLVLKQERQNFQAKEHESQQEEIAKLKDFVARNIVRASTTKRAQSRQKALDKMEIVPKPKVPPKPPSLRFEISREPVSDILLVDDLALSVGENKEVELFSDLDLHVKRGEKIAIIGHNGVGKSSFLKAALGKIPIDSGKVGWGKNTQVSYFEQGEGEMHPEKTAMQELWDDFPREIENTIRTTLGRAGIRGEEVYKKVGALSGGERARLKFAKLMLEKGNVILLDEPTNHLDLPTKEVLDKALEEYAGTLLVISHDRYLLNKFPDRIIEMLPNGIVSYKGRYNDYMLQMEKNNQALSEQQAVKKDDGQKPETRSGNRTRDQRREAAEQRQRLSELEMEIAVFEKEIAVLEEEINDPEIASDYILMEEKCILLEEKKELLNKSIEEWVVLAPEEE